MFTGNNGITMQWYATITINATTTMVCNIKTENAPITYRQVKLSVY